MPHVITKACIGTKDKSCVEVCPVDCIYEVRKKEYNDKYGIAPKKDGDFGMLMINPDECIDCGACEAECPTKAIFESADVPEELKEFIGYPEKELIAMNDEELDAARCTSKL